MSSYFREFPKFTEVQLTPLAWQIVISALAMIANVIRKKEEYQRLFD